LSSSGKRENEGLTSFSVRNLKVKFEEALIGLEA
jgi:hypothetical protein